MSIVPCLVAGKVMAVGLQAQTKRETRGEKKVLAELKVTQVGAELSTVRLSGRFAFMAGPMVENKAEEPGFWEAPSDATL